MVCSYHKSIMESDIEETITILFLINCQFIILQISAASWTWQHF